MTTFLTNRLAATGAALLLAGSLAGCSNDSTDASADTTPTVTASTPASTPAASGGASASARPQVCVDLVQARASLVKVSSVAVIAQGRDAIQAQWETAKADADTAIESARAEFPTEAQALQDAVDRVQAAVDALEATPSAAALAELGRSVVAATAAVGALETALADAC